jgi:hypothetical protein
VCVRPQSTCVRTHITARAGYATCDRGAVLRATCYVRCASMVLHAVYDRGAAACVGAVERTMAGSSL